MDAALLREREAFKRRAMAVPVVENKKSKKDKGQSDYERKKAAKAAAAGAQSHSAKAKLDLQQLKQMGSSSSQYKFSVLAKIVRHMKARHMDGEDHPLNLDEILDETNQLDVGSKTKQWLLTEALVNNPKIVANPDGTYLFKPPYDLTTKKSLLKLLKKHDLKGLGGIFLEDVQESLPKCDKIIKTLTEESKIIVVTRQIDKKKVIFYHDHMADFEVDEEFQKLWRSVAVEGLDDAKIEEYLDKQGIRSMQDNGLKKVIQPKMRKKAINRKKRAPKDNEHMKDILEDYNELSTSAHSK